MAAFYRLLALCLLSATTALAQWRTYNTSNSPLHSNVVREVAIATDGSKWVATQSAVQHLVGTTWTTYTQANGLNYTSILCIAARNGVVWVGTDKGLCRFDGTTWTNYNDPAQLPTRGGLDLAITDVVIAQTGAIWVAGSRGVAQFDGTTWTKYNSTNSYLKEEAVMALAVNDTNTLLWIATNCNSANSGVYWRSKDGATGIELWGYNNLGGNNCVHGLAVSPQTSGRVVVGTCNSSSLLTISGGVAGPATPSSCVAPDGVALDPTNPQRAWVATESIGTGGTAPKGLLVYDGTRIVQEFNTSNSGLPSNLLSSVALEQTSGLLRAWVSTADQGLAVYESTVLAERPAQTRIALAVLPNPATTALEVRTDLSRYNLAVYDNVGHLLHQQAVTQTGPVHLPLQHWAPGLYHVRLTSEQGVGYARFSKQ